MGRARTTGIPDPGIVAFDEIARVMMFDPDLTERSGRMMLWWAGPYPVVFTASEPFTRMGDQVCTVTAMVVVPVDATTEEKNRAAATLNASTATTTVVATDEAVVFSVSQQVHPGAMNFLRRVFTQAVLMTCDMAFSAPLPGRVDLSLVPYDPDSELLDEWVVSQVMRSPEQNTWVSTSGVDEISGFPFLHSTDRPGSPELVCEFPDSYGWTSLYQQTVTVPHPRYGYGLNCLLRLFPKFGDPEDVARYLNLMEVSQDPRIPILGAWTPDPHSPDDSVAHRCFLPSTCAFPGVRATLVAFAAARSQWATKILE